MRAVFRTDFIFNCFGQESCTMSGIKDFLVRAPSIELIGTMPVGGLCNSVNVWTSMPYVKFHRSNDEEINVKNPSPQSYAVSRIFHRGEPTKDNDILDFKWIKSGHFDAFPWLVTFSNRSVVIHRRPGWNDYWVPIAELTYPMKRCAKGIGISLSDSYEGSLSPADSYPHLMATLQSIVSASDEKNYLKADWNPESILAVIYSEKEGVELGMKRHLGGLLQWLSTWMDPADSTFLHWDHHSTLPSAPFESV